MKILHIVGARPQFIKLAPLCCAIKDYSASTSAAQDTPIQSIIVHTGQHYDYLMSKVFFDDLQIPEPAYNLEVGSDRHGRQTGLMMDRIEEVLIKENPDMVIVYGDTNSTLAGALAATKLHLPIAHIEAGLRSYNRRMPEEINRVLTDHISSLLLCPTKTAVLNLQKEGFSTILKKGNLLDASEKIPLPHPSPSHDQRPIVANVGDIMYESVLLSLQNALKTSRILKSLNLQTNKNEFIPYILCTIHRQENTDDQQKLQSILEALNEIADQEQPVIFPAHPRIKKLLGALDNSSLNNIRIINPVPYYDMLLLQNQAKIILTDSGGVQKEAFFLKRPCITLRDETEWIETVTAGMNIVTGADKTKILKAYHTMLKDKPQAKKPDKSLGHPFGTADSSTLILKLILKK